MGVCYYLVKLETKEAFDLDKGNWSVFLDIPFLEFLAENETQLTKIIAEQVYSGGLCQSKDETHWLNCSKCKNYFEFLAKKLFDWCGQDEIKLYRDDDWDIEELLDIQITQDRFTGNPYSLPRCFFRFPHCTKTKCVFPCKDLLDKREEMSGIKTFWWSDPHFSHKNILEFENRPFKNIDEHDRALIENYNSVIGHQDRCIWVGDCFITAKERARGIMERLNGVKIVVLGNHDHTPTQMMALGFHFACQQMQIKIAGYDVLVSHYPYKFEGETKHEIKYANLRPNDNGLWLIHGHMHSKGPKFLNKMINVGVDHWDFKPIPHSFFEGYIQKKEAEWLKKN